MLQMSILTFYGSQNFKAYCPIFLFRKVEEKQPSREENVAAGDNVMVTWEIWASDMRRF